jgi:hypothetical protein
MAFGAFYDPNRDMYYIQRDMHERAKPSPEERAQLRAEEAQLMNAAPKPDLNDPLGFLSKADNKILLTGEAA